MTNHLKDHELDVITHGSQTKTGLAHGDHVGKIAAHLGISPSTVHHRIHRAARRLNFNGFVQAQLVDLAGQHGALDALTPKAEITLPTLEAQLLTALARGLTTAQAAMQLHVGYHAAHRHRRRLYARLGARTNAHAVGLGWQHQLLGPPEQT